MEKSCPLDILHAFGVMSWIVSMDFHAFSLRFTSLTTLTGHQSLGRSAARVRWRKWHYNTTTSPKQGGCLEYWKGYQNADTFGHEYDCHTNRDSSLNSRWRWRPSGSAIFYLISLKTLSSITEISKFYVKPLWLRTLLHYCTVLWNLLGKHLN